MVYLKPKIISSLAALATVSSCAISPPQKPVNLMPGDYQYVEEYMTWFINQKMKKNKTVGLSIALVDDNRIFWQQGFGYADKEQKLKATPATIYRAGSISKLFNAIATMQLVEQNKIHLDSPLSEYLPDFKIKSRFGDTDGITPRTIMTHHSGLPGDWIDNMWSKKPLPFTRLVNEIKNEYVAYAPNTVLSYSNLGVTLLGHAVQNVSQVPYADYMQKNVLQPLAMPHSKYQQAIAGINTSKSYRKGKPITEYPLSDIPAGGLNTTVTDLGQLAIMVNNKGEINDQQIISKQSLSEILTVQNSNIPLDAGVRIGLGWFVLDKILEGKELVYGHDGGTMAHISSFMVAPESKLAVVVLTNSASASATEIATKLLQLAWSAKNGVALVPLQATTIPNHQPSDLTGIYATLLGKAKIDKQPNGHFSVNLASNRFDLRPIDGGKYSFKYKLLGILPLNLTGLKDLTVYGEQISGHQVIIGETPSERVLAGVRVKPTTISAAWKQRLGHYKIINQPEPEMFQINDLELKIEDDFLTFNVKGATGSEIQLMLRVVNDNEAIILGIGRGLGETLSVINDPEYGELITHAGLRVQKK